MGGRGREKTAGMDEYEGKGDGEGGYESERDRMKKTYYMNFVAIAVPQGRLSLIGCSKTLPQST